MKRVSSSEHRPRVRRTTPRCGICNVVVLLACCAPTEKSHAADTSTGGDAAAELRRLDGIWSHSSQTVKSLRVKGYQFFGHQRRGDTAFRRRDLDRLVRETVIPAVELGARDQESLSRLTTPIFADPNRRYDDGPQPPIGGWRPYRFIESAGKRRLDLQLQASTNSRVRKDGKEQVYQSGARQVSLYPSHSSVKMEDIACFVYVPASAKRRLNWSLGRVEDSGRLTSSGSVLDYDWQTGFVERCVDRVNDNWFLFERYQAMPVQTSAGVPVARFIAEATFWQGGDADAAPVQWLHMYVLDTIDVNGTVDASDFALAVPAGTNIVKFDNADNNRPPQDGSRPPMRLTERSVPDAAAFFAAGVAPAGVQSSPPPSAAPPEHPPIDPRKSGWSTTRIGLIAANVAALLGLFAWAKRKR